MKMPRNRTTLLTRAAAARLLGIHAETLKKWEENNLAPSRLKVGKRHYYTGEIIQQWISARVLVS